MNELYSLIQYISGLPGLGEKVAERIVLSLIERHDISKLINLLEYVHKHVSTCNVCGNIDVINPCSICINESRSTSVICVVADVINLWAIEKAEFYKGRYHVLDQRSNTTMGILPENIKIEKLITRIKSNATKEVIVALNPDINGQTAMFFIHDKLKDLGIKISTLSCGIPIGGELDRLSYGTLVVAFNQRKTL